MSRIQSRELAFEKIFSQMFTLEKNMQSDDDFDDKLEAITNHDDLKFIADILSNFAKNYEEINNNISASLKKYTLEKLYRVDLAIISVAMTELFYIQDTPINVVVNEAVQLAKKYSTENSYKFVNGFLADIIKKFNIDYKVENKSEQNLELINENLKEQGITVGSIKSKAKEAETVLSYDEQPQPGEIKAAKIKNKRK